jgi:glycine/D-amino acid oxidase-like deaminating enzyme/nitrite reductase/ring-hydroxylating ferredoxin subunit
MTYESHPIWERSDAARFPTLGEPDTAALADVIVIGAGIAGLSVALALLEEGRSVVIIEKDAIGAGQTRRTSAHLSNALDDRFYELERWHGEDGARAAAHSHSEAIDRIERWTSEYGIDCGFERIDGYLIGARSDNDSELTRERDAAARAGLDIARVDAVPQLDALGPALRFGQQARFDPFVYIAGLARAVVDRGGRFVRAEVISVNGGAAPSVRTAAGQNLGAAAIVVATNVPFHESVAIHTKQAAYRTFMIGAPIPRDAFPDILLWDTEDPYHYVRRVDDGANGASWLIVGGADHKTGQPPEAAPHADVMAWARERFPAMGDVEWTWSGQIIEPVDGLAFIGPDAGGEENVYVVTGDSGNGLTHGTIAGDLIARLIGGREDPWNGLYDPRRKPLRALGTWLSENANVAAQYGDWLAPGELRALDSIDGTVLRQGVHRIAVSRDAEGALHAFSAQCPHLGCSVRWNSTERTWDCPCHGSRFDPTDGHVINGPAACGLDAIDAPG